MKGKGNGSVLVASIPAKEALPWLLSRHYAKRKSPVTNAFGAYINSVLVGVVTYGTPASSSLRVGIAGEEWSGNVLELNRLCCLSEKNLASTLVGRSLRFLPKPSLVVSYADTGKGHVGYVYQATNFLYTGLSAKRTDWKVRGREELHSFTISDESRGKSNRADWMRKKYGDDFYLQERSRKHRYIYLCGNRKDRAAMKDALRYAEEPYPKGESKRYDASAPIETQTTFFL